ncbi:hypothetical protein AGR4A_Cc20265 [Agrobacterium tumefaciens str. B6]|uniref:Uncharacterized protein n=1 Tax=Agrobacterium tumefaciens str. B6 TaxID=1183423 RepID=A0A822UX00_AGRTU|nr:hypothetical protein AGR4A_Cc20265 [Agrobacterium tumefaciens str. B6]
MRLSACRFRHPHPEIFCKARETIRFGYFSDIFFYEWKHAGRNGVRRDRLHLQKLPR